ncbi:MAG: hypothetical protein IJ489_05145 [Clostridia bacterium]|nr:hypothetical protein [Clostridia bacterium]
MKKALAIFLIIATLGLTACNNQTVETSTYTNKTEQTESTSASQKTETTTASTQTSETTATSETTTNTAQANENQGYQVPNELKDKIIPYGERQRFIELPSRILYTHRLAEDMLMGNRYAIASNSYLCYYSKADGENYVYCFDPLCEHKDCSASAVLVSMTTYCNDRFYAINLKGCYSFAFDGTEKKKLDLSKNFGGYTFWNIVSYDIYVYINSVAPTGETHLLQLNTKTGEIVDLTEKTGKSIGIAFFYNGKIYGSCDGKSIRCDLSFENIEEYERPFLRYDLIEGNTFINAETENIMENDQYVTHYYGIKTYHFETGEETLIPTDVIGHEVSEILYADENYFYFTANEPVLVGDSPYSESDYYNGAGGKLYRINRDGTNCICIYENPSIDFLDYAMIYEDTILVHARECGLVQEYAYSWNESMYIGTINEDGTIDSLEWIEVIS